MPSPATSSLAMVFACALLVAAADDSWGPTPSCAADPVGACPDRGHVGQGHGDHVLLQLGHHADSPRRERVAKAGDVEDHASGREVEMAELQARLGAIEGRAAQARRKEEDSADANKTVVSQVCCKQTGFAAGCFSQCNFPMVEVDGMKCKGQCAGFVPMPPSRPVVPMEPETPLRYMGFMIRPDDDGFNRAGNPEAKTCFLSKKTLFTTPGAQLDPQCMSTAGLQGVETRMEEQDCQTCLSLMNGGVSGQGIPEKRLDMANYYKKATPVSSANQQDPAHPCDSCSSAWGSLCFLKGVKYTDEMQKKDFKKQQAFMNDLAAALQRYRVALYLDFADTKAEEMIKEYGGRDVSFSNPVFWEGMQALLAERAERATHFIQWKGSGGAFCLAEQAGDSRKNQASRMNKEYLSFPPIAAAQTPTGGNPDDVCRVDPANGYESFLQTVCTLCGGTGCEQSCK